MAPTAEIRPSRRFAALFHAFLRLPAGVHLALVMGLGVLIGLAIDNARRDPAPAVMTQAQSPLGTSIAPHASGTTAPREAQQESPSTPERAPLTAVPGQALEGTGTLPAGTGDSVRGGGPDSAGSEEGTVEGVRVFPGRNRGAFAGLGLHPGDLVTAVNGAKVSGDADLKQMLQGGGTITVYRAGQLQTIAFPPPPVEESDEAGSAHR